jgi:hypothetical protein
VLLEVLSVILSEVIEKIYVINTLQCISDHLFRKYTAELHACSLQKEAENLSLVLQDNGIDAKVVSFTSLHNAQWSYIQTCGNGDIIVFKQSYHGGMNPAERKRVQEHFCSNKLRVVTNSYPIKYMNNTIEPFILLGIPVFLLLQVVATVAFGLGLDKCDVSVVSC